MIWNGCDPMTNEEHLFTGLSYKIDEGDKKYSYEEEFKNDLEKIVAQ